MHDTIDQLKKFYHEEKRMPTYSEMMHLFGYKSKNAVYKLVQKLLDSGFVDKDHLGRLLPTKIFNEIPFVGLVKAGLPSEVDELTDTLDFNALLINRRKETFVLEVDGDSMIDLHIEPGDMVIVERTNTAHNGDIVVALVDGESTMKTFRSEGKKVWLEPANKKYNNIYPTRSLEISGIVRGVVRKY